MIRIYAVILILLAGLMVIGCSSQSNVKASKGKTSKEESELKDPADVIYQTNKNNNKQTVILEFESK
jgi:PBP1b-binding outer membrane lipoprotein LpoB